MLGYCPDYCSEPFHRGAIFTVELGTLLENGFDIGLDRYPIFDEEYRMPLNDKIIEHFFFREIGLETPELFRRFLNRKMNEVMPFYNQLYKSALKDIDPYVNYAMQTEGTNSGESTQERESERTEHNATDATAITANKTKSKARTLSSATPQMQLSGREDYATNITDSDSDTDASGTSRQKSGADTESADKAAQSAKSSEEYASRVFGLSGMTQSQALLQFRETLLNIDMLVIHELDELFMGIYTDYWNAL